MVSASVILFLAIWNAVGGWPGIRANLARDDVTLPERMLHVSSQHVETIDVSGQSAEQIARHLLVGGAHDSRQQTISRHTPAWLACISFVLVGMAYSIVNHEQSMRLFAARSIWDMKMSAAVAGLLLIGMTYFNLMMGVMGRAMYPSRDALPVHESLRQTADAIYPILVRDFTTIGWKGMVVAGLLAAAISTYAGIGSAMSAVLTRDVYARLMVRDRNDRHYLVVGRWLTLAVMLASFLYVPFLLQRGMMMFYLDLVAAFVIPLLTIYLMGIFTRVHRRSGTIGLLAGVVYGAWRLAAGQLALGWGVAILPSIACDSFAAYPISLAITAGTMIAVSLVLGWEPRGTLVHQTEAGWLQRSRLEVLHLDSVPELPRNQLLPVALGLLVAGLGAALSFLVFW
jgi:SSS family solute:Na+ symporter